VSDDAATAREATALQRRVEEAVGAIFEVEEEIGRGGMAVVYRALDKRLRRKVALKVLPPDLAFRSDVRSRFVREAQMAAQLSHAHIVPIFAVDETGGIVYFAMGLVEGETLAKQLANNPRPSVDSVRRILREVAEGLAYAHDRGVVHRDVKPDNILIEKSGGRSLVSDFGIARAAEGDLRLTVTGVAVGTPAYMSPEQAMGEKDVDGRADIYALGVVGWQMLAGELPFQSENTPGMLMKHISEPPRPLSKMRSDLPANLVYAIERAMAKSRKDRWPDALAFRDALDERASAPPSAFSNAHTPAEPVRAWDRGASPGAGVALSGPPPIRSERDRDPAPGELRGPSSSKPWRFDPLRDAALQSDSGAQALREWRAQRQAWRDRYKAAPVEEESLSFRERMELRRETRRDERDARDARRVAKERAHEERTPEELIRSVQRNAVRYAITVSFLAAINMITSPQFPWFLFPALGMGVALASRVGSLWVDGIPLWRLFRRQPRDTSQGALEPGGPSSGGRKRELPRLAAPDLRGVSSEMLDGPYGSTIREAAEAKVMINDVITRLPEHERLNLPDVQTTANALEERIRALAGAMHQLDRDASPDAMRKLERKLADARAGSGDAAERERRVGLLERQHATLKDLADRRNMVAQQLENAAVLLQTMKLDLLKLRSSGIESKIADSTLATQEARAVALDIERVVDAANEVRKL
jgi:serine/threonine protein kinase